VQSRKHVARLVGHGADLRIDKLVAAAERLLQRGAARMVARLPLVDLAGAEEPADVGVVVAELLDLPLPRRADNKSGCRRYGRNTSSRA
jgi:hypothetical protein